MKWFCFSSLYYNNFHKKTSRVDKTKFYRSCKNQETQKKYHKVLMNWIKNLFSSEHRFKGICHNCKDLSNVILTYSQILKMGKKRDIIF